MRTLLLLALVVAATRAQAEEVPNHPALQDRFYFGAGVFFPRTATPGAAQSSNCTGLGTTVDFENALHGTLEDRADRARPLAHRSSAGASRPSSSSSTAAASRASTAISSGATDVSGQYAGGLEHVQLLRPARLGRLLVLSGTADKGARRRPSGCTWLVRLSLSSTTAGHRVGRRARAAAGAEHLRQFALTERWALGARMDRFSLNYDKFDGSLTSALGLRSHVPAVPPLRLRRRLSRRCSSMRRSRNGTRHARHSGRPSRGR